jgi:uncharacterized protein (DUF1810 family)
MTNTSGPFDLQRFLDAQREIYGTALAELRSGRKRTHWMWFMFPQIRGLGSSAMATRYAIASEAEARAYLAEDTLQSRLTELTRTMLALTDVSARDVLGYPDDVKFKSCMTLFATVADDPIFNKALDRFFGGEPDELTLAVLRGSNA